MKVMAVASEEMSSYSVRGKAEEERDLEALDPAPELHGSGAAPLLRQTLGANAGPSCSLFDGEE